jgi:hypothetical protein
MKIEVMTGKSLIKAQIETIKVMIAKHFLVDSGMILIKAATL